MKIKRDGDPSNQYMLTHTSDRVIMTEKLDGSCLRVKFVDGEIRIGSRREILDRNPGSVWATVYAYIKETMTGSLNPDYTYFGEFIRIHRIQYDLKKVPLFLGFDILDDSIGEYLDHDVMTAEYSRIGLPTVPVLYDGVIGSLPEITFPKKSLVDPGVDMEGVVMKNYSRKNRDGSIQRMKIVDPRYAEKKIPKKPTTHDNESTILICDTFITEARIEKKLEMLRDEDHTIDMSLMKHLPMEVMEDMLTEEILTIFRDRQYKGINFEILRKEMANRCIPILRKHMNAQ